MEYVQLNNGIKMPMLGYGVYQVTKDECERCVTDALSVGYRLIDTAQSYFNEEEVGTAIAKSGIKREDIFLTTKVWVEHYGYEACKKSVYTSLEKLKTDYLDLMLLHQPFSDYYGAYRALEELYNEDVLRAIGVSNFYPDRLVDIASFANIVPMVNQVETHVLNQQKVAKEYMDKYGVQCEAWAPFGEGRGGLFENETLVNIGKQYGKTAAQVMLRWNIQRGVVVLPKSTHRDRMIQNIDVFDFTLSDEDELQREGITVPEERIVYGDLWYTSGERLAQELLSGERPMPEAVIAASDHMALGLIEQLTKNGVRVPEDLIVLESEATSEAITGDISLSSYESNDAKTAADAVDAIRRQIEPDAPILPYEPEMDTMFHAGMSCGCQPDLVRSGQAFKDSLYLLTRNYSASDLLDHIDIGFLMESYVSEQFSAAETPEYCLHAIFDSTYLLSPFENFFLCLKEDRLDTSRDIADGYPAQMQIALAASSVGEAAFCRRSDAILFDTGEMLPRLQAESETPSVFYFSPVHFNEKMLGYAVLQRSLTDPHPIDLVYRNWLRFVNNALQMIRVQRRLLHLSVHDEMTGAYDRRGMYTAVEKLLQNAPEGASVLACVIDMDGLKYINDTFGHDEGDFGIRTVAQAAQKLTGPEEIFVRAGGDEFYILGIGIYDSAEINRRILAFEADMTDRSNRAAKPYPLTASIGCSLHRLAEQDSIHNAIRDADAAMYRYKTKRKRDRTV